MIFIVAKFSVRPESVDSWHLLTEEFTRATRGEPGCLWFEWSRSLEDPNQFVLVEAFADSEAGAAHVLSPHFKAAQAALPAHLARTPDIVHVNDSALTGWAALGEFAVDDV